MVGVILAGWLLAGAAGVAQVEIDRTLQHVYGTAIMASDVREAIVLKLFPEAIAGDQAVLTALENRLLMLREVSRVAPTEPGPDAIAARKSAWHAAWPAGTDLTALMLRTGTTEQALDGWFRDDLRIASYLDQRFGRQADAARAGRIAGWLTELRRRANLTGKITQELTMKK